MGFASAFGLLDQDLFGDTVLESFDVADDADQLIGTGKGSQGVDGFLQGVGVQRAKAFIHKQGIHADAAGTFLDGIADAKSQAERRQKLSPPEREPTGRVLPV